jgi:outer membrane protein OmpA-like peptidoglycan-associated protein
MPMSSVAVRSFALAIFSFGTASALAQTANVTAFNPYSGVGAPGGPSFAGDRRPYPIVEQAVPTAGPAFNPWQQTTVTASRGPASAGPTPTYSDDAVRPRLPAPPPGPIHSRLVAIPQRGDTPGATRALQHNPTPTPAPPAAVAPAIAPPAPTAAAPAAPAPVPVVRQPETPTVAPEAPRAVATVAPPPPEPVAPPPPPSAPTATVLFVSQSAEIDVAARAELDRIAKTLGRTRQIELRAYAGGRDPTESRKIALARALTVRSYLIDQGVTARIEIGAFSANGGGSSNERVDVMAPP